MGDRPNFVALEADPHVMLFINGGRPVPQEGVGPSAGFLTPRGGEDGIWSAFETASGDFVGWISLVERESDVAELGYRIRAESWGRGFASEGARLVVDWGFEAWNLKRVTATTMTVNHASRRVLEKTGFVYVRTLRLDWPDPIAGSEHGGVQYEITRETFIGRRAPDSITPRPASVRRARAEDADALVAILRDTFESTWRPQISEQAARAFVAENRPAEFVGRLGLRFWVAERDGQVVGLVYWDADFVHSLHVLGDHAHQGIGTCLMDCAEAQIAEGGFARVRLETDTFNSNSRAFYEARGYREADGYPDQEWNSGLTTLLLVKQLGR